MSDLDTRAVEYSIRGFRVDDVDEFLDLHSRTFDAGQDRRWFAWKYEDNPYVDHVPILVAEADGELVGARPFFALDMSVGGDRRLALQPADTMVHPDHRRQGLFTRMTEAAIDRYSDSEASFFFNFPNRQSKPGYLNLGWQNVADWSTYYRIQHPAAIARNRSAAPPISAGCRVLEPLLTGYNRLSNARSTPENGVRVNAYESVPSATMAAIDRRREGIHALRDERFYDWRFDNPNWDYTTYVAEESGVPVAGVIAGTSVGSGPTTTKVTDLVPLPRETANRGLETLLNRVVRDHADSDLLVAPSLLPRASANRAGFHADDRPPIRYVANRTAHVVRSLTDEWVHNGVDISDDESWWFTFSERDTS